MSFKISKVSVSGGFLDDLDYIFKTFHRPMLTQLHFFFQNVKIYDGYLLDFFFSIFVKVIVIEILFFFFDSLISPFDFWTRYFWLLNSSVFIYPYVRYKYLTFCFDNSVVVMAFARSLSPIMDSFRVVRRNVFDFFFFVEY